MSRPGRASGAGVERSNPTSGTKTLGKGLAEFRRATEDLKDEFRKMEHEVEDASTAAMLGDDPSLEKPLEKPIDPAVVNPPNDPEKK